MIEVKAVNIAFIVVVTTPTISKATPRLPREHIHAGRFIHSVNFFMVKFPVTLSASKSAGCAYSSLNALRNDLGILGT